MDSYGGRLTGNDIHAYIVNEFGKHYHPDSIDYLLNHMGFSWITSSAKPPLVNPSKSKTILKNSTLKRSLRSPVTWGLITSMSGFKMKQDLASKTRQLDFGLSVAQDQEW
ncbi:winged helix-turn-helix domain-containing protein [Vibrio vulnificus]|nr:winged helix-turn-helix domain-containing protein [Vibrio vulnificus]